MRRMAVRSIVAALLLLVGTSVAQAQFASPIRFNLHGGAALPVGDAGDTWDLGFRLGAGLEFRVPLFPVGLRIDGAYDRLGSEFGDATLNIWSATGNAVLSPMMLPIYFIGGIGAYWPDTGEPGEDTEAEFGFNLGGGFQMPVPGFSPFIEARWHRITGDGADFDYVPIVFGIRF